MKTRLLPTVVSDGFSDTMPRGIGAEEALKLVPGVKVDNQADGERVHLSIRGQGLMTERGIRGIKILLDGLPLNDPSGFAPDLFDVDWYTVQRMEVFRGPASALYGGGSAGGVINIETRDGGTKPMTGDRFSTAGKYDFYKLYGELGGTQGATNYRISASNTAGDGYRVHTAFNAMNLYGKFSWKLGQRGKLTAIVAGTNFWNENAEGLNPAAVSVPAAAESGCADVQRISAYAQGYYRTYGAVPDRHEPGLFFQRLLSQYSVARVGPLIS